MGRKGKVETMREEENLMIKVFKPFLNLKNVLKNFNVVVTYVW